MRLTKQNPVIYDWKIRFRFELALIVAAAYSVRHPVASWPRLVRFWMATKTAKRVDDRLRQSRLVVCRSCPIFHHGLQTCGSPLNKRGFRHLGCHCFMPVKAGLKAATCWLDDELQDSSPHGWHLLSQPAEPQIVNPS